MADDDMDRAERLAFEAAERAATATAQAAERVTAAAVARAIRDERVDRDLRDHERHLQQVNGSQERMAKSLEALEASFSKLNISTEAVAKYVAGQTSGQFSKRTLIVAWVAAAATWVAIIAALGTAVL